MKQNLMIVLVTFALIACSGSKTSAGEGDEKMVLIETQFGNITVKLYNETPLHRDNFIKLANEGFYDDLLFHRVINGFMIQGGDPDSKNASADKRLGAGDPGYQIPAEIVDKYYHKKGALAAARQGDNANPERKSSGSQFYIVQGKVIDQEMIFQLEEKQKIQAERMEAMKIFREKQALIQRLQSEGKADSINFIRVQIQEEAEKSVVESMYKIDDEKSRTYTTIGGTPHLDGAYTVFGEVIDGLNVIDSIANVATDSGNRPLENVKMKMKVLN